MKKILFTFLIIASGLVYAGNIDGKPFNTNTSDSIFLSTNFGINGIDDLTKKVIYDSDFLRSCEIYTIDCKLIKYDNITINGIYIVIYKNSRMKLFISK